MKDIIETLYPIDRQLLGKGYDKSLEYLQTLLDFEILEFPSRYMYGTWTIPDEWVVKDAWIKYKGKKIVSYKKEPLSLVVYSLPFQGTVKLEELKKHIHHKKDKPNEKENKDAVPYTFKFYERDWGFSLSENQFNKLEEGDYEVFIDTEFKPGLMKIAVHTIPGEIPDEILLFAHLDHPYQANDNLSGVACLVDLAKKIKSKHTIKIIICPETIGSIVYAHTQDLSNVAFVLAVDICGNDNTILVQKAYNKHHEINSVAHCALQQMGTNYRKGEFRTTIGSDESVFNDPRYDIGGILVSTYPYPEYHTNADKPEIINYKKIKEVQKLIQKIIEIWDKNYIPFREYDGLLMRSRYEIQSPHPQVNLNLDYFFFAIDGMTSLAELCAQFEFGFDFMYDILEKIKDDGKLSRVDFSEIAEYPITEQEY